MKNLSEIQKLELHDSSIVSICFITGTKSIEMCVTIWDEQCNDYINLILQFFNVDNFISDSYEFLLSDEIYSMKITENEGSRFGADFTILMGFAKPSLSFQFSFDEVVCQSPDVS